MVRISVEISTYNRRPVLERVLGRLAAQTLPPGEFEVIVSDDGSTDGTQAWLLDYAKRSPYRVTLVQNDHSGPGGTHNQGILRAEGDLVQMLADDVLATPRLLEHHVRMHELHPDPAVAVVGSLEQSPEMPDTVFQRAWNAVLEPMYPRDRVELGYRDFWVNNLSFKKAFFVQNGLFHPWPAASHEDVELGYRLEQRGMRLLFCSDALGFHHHPETIDTACRRAFAQGSNWHFFESHVPEAWVRARSGNFRAGDPLAPRVRRMARGLARAVLFNRVTVPKVFVPMIREAERKAWLAPAVPLCARKVVSHYFHQGLRAGGAGVRATPGGA